MAVFGLLKLQPRLSTLQALLHDRIRCDCQKVGGRTLPSKAQNGHHQRSGKGTHSLVQCDNKTRHAHGSFANVCFRGDEPKIQLSAEEKEQRKSRLKPRETAYILDYPDNHPTVDSPFRQLMRWLQFYFDRLFQLHGTIVAGVAVPSARPMVEIFPSCDADIRARLEFGLTTNPIGPEGLHIVSTLVKQVHFRRSGLHVDTAPPASSNAAPSQDQGNASGASASESMAPKRATRVPHRVLLQSKGSSLGRSSHRHVCCNCSRSSFRPNGCRSVRFSLLSPHFQIQRLVR